MRRAAVLCLALLAGCTAAKGDGLVAGTWRGDLTTPGGRPFGALFHVSYDDGALALALESQYVRQRFTDVRAEGGGIAFTWPGRTTRHCSLKRTDSGFLGGRCDADGAEPILVVMVPPGRDDVPLGLARGALESGIAWAEARHGTMRVLVEEGTLLDMQGALRDSAAVAFRDAFALLETTPPRVPFWFFYVDSRSTLGRLVGWPAGGWADGVARAAANTVSPAGRSPDRHEIMHVAALAIWGIPADPWQWINEGLATWAQGECAGNGVHSVAAALRARGETVPLSRLTRSFPDVDEIVAYMQAASFVGWFLETFGTAALRSVWQEGAHAFTAHTGWTLEQAERGWHGRLDGIDARAVDLQAIRLRGCL